MFQWPTRGRRLETLEKGRIVRNPSARSGFNLKWPPEVSFTTPEYGVKNLEVKVEERKVRIEIPEFKTWVILVVGEKLFPSVELRLKKRDGVPVVNTLDNAFIPGVEIEVEAEAEGFTDCSLSLHTPEGWKYEEGDSRQNTTRAPARFYVYSKGVERNIMHSYPNLYFVDDLDEAKLMLKKGRYVALWLVNQDPEEYGPLADEFLSMKGGVVWMGEPFPSVNCPVTLEEKSLESKSISYLNAGGSILEPALRKRSMYESETVSKHAGLKPGIGVKPSQYWENRRRAPPAILRIRRQSCSLKTLGGESSTWVQTLKLPLKKNTGLKRETIMKPTGIKHTFSTSC